VDTFGYSNGAVFADGSKPMLDVVLTQQFGKCLSGKNNALVGDEVFRRTVSLNGTFQGIVRLLRAAGRTFEVLHEGRLMGWMTFCKVLRGPPPAPPRTAPVGSRAADEGRANHPRLTAQNRPKGPRVSLPKPHLFSLFGYLYSRSSIHFRAPQKRYTTRNECNGAQSGAMKTGKYLLSVAIYSSLWHKELR